eukprot:Sro742_g195971.2  (106) ;mRNA; r:45363-45680
MATVVNRRRKLYDTRQHTREWILLPDSSLLIIFYYFGGDSCVGTHFPVCASQVLLPLAIRQLATMAGLTIFGCACIHHKDPMRGNQLQQAKSNLSVFGTVASVTD